VEDGADGISILATIESQHGKQALSDALIIGLFEASPHILALRTAYGNQLLAHGISR
jgi:hypothetical protein